MPGRSDHNDRAPTEMLVMPQVPEPDLRDWWGKCGNWQDWETGKKQPSTHPITSPTIPVVHAIERAEPVGIRTQEWIGGFGAHRQTCAWQR